LENTREFVLHKHEKTEKTLCKTSYK